MGPRFYGHAGAPGVFSLAARRRLLSSFESSPGKLRRFCTRCGSHIVADRPNQPNVLLRLGCLDTPVTDRPKPHMWRSEAASWYDPGDVLPEFPEAPS